MGGGALWQQTTHIMKTAHLLLVTTAAISLLASCTGPRSVQVERQSLHKDANGKLETTLFWSHYDASHRSSLFKVDENGKLTILAENPPDAAVEKSLGIVGDVKVGDKVTAKATLDAVQSIAELGQRTAAVNILRDALYRLAELCNNSTNGMNSPMSSDVKDIMLKTLETCEKVSIEMAKETSVTKRAEMVKDLKEMYLAIPEAERDALELEEVIRAL